jgi:WXG100 family type VII secretion target
MAGNTYFKEDPQQIAAVASRLQQQRSSFASGLSAIKNKANGLKSYWKSDGADEYQKKAAELDAGGQQIAAALDEFVKKLQQASGIYTTGEQAAKTAAQGLPTSGVFR